MIDSGFDYIGVDLFSGAGGLSLGAELAGVEVALAVEKDVYASSTYQLNHPKTKVISDDIRDVKRLKIFAPSRPCKLILFGGPPCQGFSTSNQRTRNKENRLNWLFSEFLRMIDLCMPDWVVFENVKGFVNTEGGAFLVKLIDGFQDRGYEVAWYVLNAADFGIPQSRKRFFAIASREGYKLNEPKPDKIRKVTVREAISDLPSLTNGASIDCLAYDSEADNSYARLLRGKQTMCTGHLVSKNADYVLERYKHIPQGGNWKDIPAGLMGNYTERNRCHHSIYYRLNPDEPAITIGNYRKAMLVHPWENRGLSVREAARLQSFPDSYIFTGPIGFQQQQVGNAVPPLLAKKIFSMIKNGEYKE